MRRLRALAAIVAGLLVAPLAAAAGSAEKGKAAYVKHGCWQCHGFVGQGSVAGVKIAPNPMPFEALSAYVRNTNGSMPKMNANDVIIIALTTARSDAGLSLSAARSAALFTPPGRHTLGALIPLPEGEQLPLTGPRCHKPAWAFLAR